VFKTAGALVGQTFDQMKQICEAERDKEIRSPHLCQLSNGDQSNEVLATVNEVAAERFPVRLTAYARVALKQNCMEHSERFHLIFSRIHSRVLFL
jgi:hypothetical protein